MKKVNAMKRIGAFVVTLVLILTVLPAFTTPVEAVQIYMKRNYYLKSALNENMVVDVAGGNHTDGTNIQLYQYNGSAAQIFHLERAEEEGYMYIVHTASGKVLDVAGGGTSSGTNVWLYTKNGTDAQLWKPYLAANSQVNISFQAKCGKFLDVCGGETANGTNIWIYDGNDTLSQAFHLVPADWSLTAYVNTTSLNLNLRSAPSTSASIIGKLPKGTAVEIVSILDSGWTQVAVNGQVGFVSSEYLQFPSSQSSSNTPTPSNEDQITARLADMQNGTFANGTYQVGTVYTGPYANEQCKGFAKSVYEKLFGYNIGSTRSKPYNFQIGISSSKTSLVGSIDGLSGAGNDSVRSLFDQARPGDFIQLRRDHGGSHSAIYLSSDANGVTVYECNVDEKNGIRTKTYSYSKFCEDNAAVSVYTPIEYYLH